MGQAGDPGALGAPLLHHTRSSTSLASPTNHLTSPPRPRGLTQPTGTIDPTGTAAPVRRPRAASRHAEGAARTGRPPRYVPSYLTVYVYGTAASTSPLVSTAPSSPAMAPSMVPVLASAEVTR